MGKCPFIAVQRLTREITRDATGTVIDEKEIPGQELRECLRQECELFDSQAGRCSLPTMEAKISASQTALPSTDLGTEIRETRESMVASLLHVLKKADTHNDWLQRLHESIKGLPAPAGDSQSISPLVERIDRMNEKLASLVERLSSATQADSAPLLAPLAEIKEALNNTQTKFGDILELILEDHQKQAAREDQQSQSRKVLEERLAEIKDSLAGLKEALIAAGGDRSGEALAPLAKSLDEIKEALNNSQTKFGDILELILEDQQKRAAEGSRTAELLESLGQKQEAMAAAIVQGFKETAAAGSRDDRLAATVEKIEAALIKLTQAEESRQQELAAVGAKMLDLQQSLQNLLEAQRNEQRAASNERRRREAEEHNERGVMYFHRRELTAAEREFGAAIEIRPDFAEAYNNLGLTLSDLGRKEEAVAAFKKAIELAPEAPEAYNNLGCLYKVKKDFQQAVEFFNQAIAKRQDYALAYFNLGLAYEETEKFDLAIKSWEKVLALQPTHEEARRKLATYRARRI